MSKVLVTGSAGFIGKHLMKALGERGIPYDLKDDYHMTHDILDYETLRRAMKPAQIVIHLAAISNRQAVDHDPIRAIETNIIGTYNVLKAAQSLGIKKVLLASSAATARPDLSLYGMTKAGIELLGGLFPEAVIVRFYNVYGKGGKGVINKFIRQVKKGEPLILNGNTTRDYIYVSDIVGGLMEIIDIPMRGRIFELGTGSETSLQDLAKMVMKLSNKKVPVIKKKPLPEIQQSKMDLKYRFFKPVSLEEGIKELI